jgi:pimeloyl-ACP methyl ester carboxylesterase
MPTVRAGDADIGFEVAGDGDPILLITGFAAEAKISWMFQVPTFAQLYRVITFDNRGVGASSASPVAGVSMEVMAQDALAVLDAAGAERAHVVGISMGGAIAQHVALKAPERVRSLVLASTWCARNSYLPRLARVGEDLMSAGGHMAIVRASMLWLFTPKFILEHGELVDAVEAMAGEMAVPTEAFHEQQRAIFDHDVRDRLGALEMPVRVMVGRRDTFVPPELSEQLSAAIPGSELVILEGGHAFNIEERDAFNAAVLEFLARN